MAGVKGRSGRKSRVDENTRDEVLLQSWELLKRFYNSPGIPLIRKAEIASKLAGRNIPQTPIVIDQSKHTHLTTVNLSELNQQELVNFLTGRNGFARKPANQG
jgi:hypothetical protein